MKKHYKLLFVEKAKEEVSFSRKYYNKCRAGLGNEFILELKRTTNLIIENPLQFPEIIPKVREANTLRFPFSIFYHLQDDNIVKIIAVFHSSRNPEIWQTRVENKGE